MAGGVIFERLVALGEHGLEGDDLAVAENDEGLDVADVDGAVREGLGGERDIGGQERQRGFELRLISEGGGVAGGEVGYSVLELFAVRVLLKNEAFAFVADGFEGDDFGVLRVNFAFFGIDLAFFGVDLVLLLGDGKFLFENGDVLFAVEGGECFELVLACEMFGAKGTVT